MMQRTKQSIREGAIGAKTFGIYGLMWLLGVPGLIMIALFVFGVGR